jgi:hypothetical protein
MNTRVEYTSGDIAAGQLAPSQAARTNFTPGKTNGQPLDQNWPLDFRIPTGTPAFDRESAGPVKVARTVVVKLGRNIVSDQVIAAPVAGAPVTTTITDTLHWGDTTPEHTLTPTDTQNVNGSQERRTGSNEAVSA